MSANLEVKKQVVEDIKARIQAAKSVVFIDYKGLTVAEDTDFRSEFRKADCEYKVLKNTLVRKALNDLGVTDFDADLNGPTAVAFGKDETSAAKVVCEACKKFNDKISVKSAYVDGSYVDANGVKVFAAIPSKEVLLAKMLGSLKSPLTGLAIAINAIAEKQQG